MVTTSAAAYFTCLGCDLVGSEDKTAEKHTEATKHMTLTGVDVEALARMRARIVGAA